MGNVCHRSTSHPFLHTDRMTLHRVPSQQDAICYFHYFHYTPQKQPALLLRTSSSCWHHHCLKLGAVNRCLRTLTKMKIAVFKINMSTIVAWQVGGSAPSLCAICLACTHDFVSIHPKILFCGTEATVLKLLPDSLWLYHKKTHHLQQRQHNLLRRAHPEYHTDQKQFLCLSPWN